MRRLTRLVGLRSSERRLLLRAFVVVGVAQAALWLLPLVIVRRVVARTAGAIEQVPVERFVWAVNVASRYLLRPTCLAQAMATHALLTGAGYASSVEIGVVKDAVHGFEAHAWVICDNEIVIGGPDVARYVRLTAWDR